MGWLVEHNRSRERRPLQYQPPAGCLKPRKSAFQHLILTHDCSNALCMALYAGNWQYCRDRYVAFSSPIKRGVVNSSAIAYCIKPCSAKKPMVDLCRWHLARLFEKSCASNGSTVYRRMQMYAPAHDTVYVVHHVPHSREEMHRKLPQPGAGRVISE